MEERGGGRVEVKKLKMQKMRGKKRESRSCGDLALAFVVFGDRSEAYSMVVRDEEVGRGKERDEAESDSFLLALRTKVFGAVQK